MDKVYLSKVFSFTPDYTAPIYADEVARGGSGYCIELENGKEVYKRERDTLLPPEIRSAREAAKANHMSYQTVLDRCNGKVKNPYALDGFTYRFEDAGPGRKKTVTE